MDIGIVGLPNVGKSTLFNALTGAGAAAENFPFTTIEPNVGVVPLSDSRLTYLAEKHKSKKTTPTGVRFVDIAGIVKGASQGEGLGNKFLHHIRNVDAITHVIRVFKDENVVNTTGDLNPLHACDIIETELLLADLQQAQKALERYEKPAKSGDHEAKEKVELLKKAMDGFNEGQSARTQNLPEEFVNEFQFLSAKPTLYVANTDEGTPDLDIIEPLKKRAQQENAGLITLCTKLEAEILELPLEERRSYYDAAGITSPGLSRLAQAGKELLNLICFFTCGENEARAWLIPKGTKAPKAAGKIHTDMERGFIRAEVYKFNDFVEHGTEAALRQKGLITLEGKEYEIQEGDIVFFRFNV